MKIIALSLLVTLPLLGCAGKTPKPKYMEEKNQAKYGQTRAFAEAPDVVLRAARAVLDELTQESEPSASGAVKEEGDTLATGWVYGTAKDKYVRYDYNGSPRRKALAVRRTYAYTVQPSLAGTQVAMQVEEEIQEVDLKSGAPKGWKKVQPDTATYDFLTRRLQEQIRK